MVPLRGLKDLPGTDTVRLRPIDFYVGDPAGLPAPGVVDQQLGVDAKQLIEQRLVIVFPDLPDGAPGDISHGVDADGLELFGIAFSHPPEVGQRAVHPKLSAVLILSSSAIRTPLSSGATCLAMMFIATLQR